MCGHEWLTDKVPSHCAKCKSRQWNQKLMKQCECGCGEWFQKRRKIDRFFSTACRVRHHQADPDFKEKRRIEARKLYREERPTLTKHDPKTCRTYKCGMCAAIKAG
jgi:hypothetical protein